MTTTTSHARPATDDRTATNRTLSLLRAGVPLSLLMDLAAPHGPRSTELYAMEPAESLSWIVARAS